jgi:hypothetical protein
VADRRKTIAVNNFRGDLMRHMHFALALSAAALACTAQGANVRATTGQLMDTPWYLPNGYRLTVRNVQVGNSLFTYRPEESTFNPAEAWSTLDGFMAWANTSLISFSKDAKTTVTEVFINDPSYELDDPNGLIKKEVRIGSAGSAMELDNVSGTLLSASGFRLGNQSSSNIRAWTTGGTFNITNLRYAMQEKVAYGDAKGTRSAIGTKPSQSYQLTSTSLWSVDTVSGPLTLPLANLSTAASVSDLPAILRQAGFNVTSATDQAIVFSGLYTFKGVRYTPAMTNFYCQALGCLTTGKNAFAGVATMTPVTGIGDFTTWLTFSIPLRP